VPRVGAGRRGGRLLTSGGDLGSYCCCGAVQVSWVPPPGGLLVVKDPRSPVARSCRLRNPLRVTPTGMPTPLSVTWTLSARPATATATVSTVAWEWSADGLPQDDVGVVGQRRGQSVQHPG